MEPAQVIGDEGFKPPPKNQDLGSLSEIASEVLSQYGWYLLLVSVLVYLLIQYLNQRRTSHSSHTSTTQTPQDGVLVARRQEAMEAARRKMQEELDAKAAVFKEKQKQQEEEKRAQKIEVWESMQQGKSYKGTKLSQTADAASSSTTVLQPKTAKKSLRSTDYNPLTGQGGGGSCSFRPGRRGPSSGG